MNTKTVARLMIVLIVAIALSGCSMFRKKTDPVPPLEESPVTGERLEQQKPVEIDARLLQKCEAFPEAKALTPVQVLEIKKNETRIHVECMQRHNNLVDVLLKFVTPKVFTN